MLIEHTLFGVVDKVAEAIKLLRDNEPPEGYFLCFSGDKDSVTIYRLAQMAGVKFDAHYNITTVEPPELLAFVKEHYPTVILEPPQHTMEELIIKKKIPPTRIMRYCTTKLKSTSGNDRFKIVGIRAEESRNRAKRPQIENDRNGSGKFISPIHRWTTSDVWQFIHENNIPYCSLYDEGYKRLGCVLCPFHSDKQRRHDMIRFPTVTEYYREACRKSFEANRDTLRGFQSGDDIFDWWINANRSKPKTNSMPLFEEVFS